MAAAAPAAARAPEPAAAGPANFYLNLHQCVYNNGSIIYTNLLPNTANTDFNTGTKVSSTIASSVECKSGAGGWSPQPVNSAVYNFDRFGKNDRYLNLHQCAYNNGSIIYTNLLPNTANTGFNAGTNVSTTADTNLVCGQVSGWRNDSVNSALYSIDLTGRSGRYVNLHQCAYNNGSIIYTNLLPNTANTDFNTGTNVSDTKDTAVECGDPAGWRVDTANSAVYSIDLLA
ncbi:hypothetical protein [Streptomyces rubiginosohelvolus]